MLSRMLSFFGDDSAKRLSLLDSLDKDPTKLLDSLRTTDKYRPFVLKMAFIRHPQKFEESHASELMSYDKLNTLFDPHQAKDFERFVTQYFKFFYKQRAVNKFFYFKTVLEKYLDSMSPDDKKAHVTEMFYDQDLNYLLFDKKRIIEQSVESYPELFEYVVIDTTFHRYFPENLTLQVFKNNDEVRNNLRERYFFNEDLSSEQLLKLLVNNNILLGIYFFCLLEASEKLTEESTMPLINRYSRQIINGVSVKVQSSNKYPTTKSLSESLQRQFNQCKSPTEIFNAIKPGLYDEIAQSSTFRNPRNEFLVSKPITNSGTINHDTAPIPIAVRRSQTLKPIDTSLGVTAPVKILTLSGKAKSYETPSPTTTEFENVQAHGPSKSFEPRVLLHDGQFFQKSNQTSHHSDNSARLTAEVLSPDRKTPATKELEELEANRDHSPSDENQMGVNAPIPVDRMRSLSISKVVKLG